MTFTEEQLRNYAKPLSETEEKQCKNAIRMVVDALETIGFNERTSIQRMCDLRECKLFCVNKLKNPYITGFVYTFTQNYGHSPFPQLFYFTP